MATSLVFKETDINLEFFGLRPLSTHYFYYNGNQVVSEVKQIGKKLGQPLVADENGYLNIILYLSSGIAGTSSRSFSEKVSILAAGPQTFVVTNLDVATLPLNFENASSSYAKMLTTVRSSQ